MSKRKEKMYFRITIPALQDGKKDEAISFVKDKVMPEFDGTPGLISMTAAITGALFDGNSAISWNIWDTQEAMDNAVEKLQGALDSESESDLFDGTTIAYMGPVYAGKLFVAFKEGETPN